jgi:hypothetical protein
VEEREREGGGRGREEFSGPVARSCRRRRVSGKSVCMHRVGDKKEKKKIYSRVFQAALLYRHLRHLFFLLLCLSPPPTPLEDEEEELRKKNKTRVPSK